MRPRLLSHLATRQHAHRTVPSARISTVVARISTMVAHISTVVAHIRTVVARIGAHWPGRTCRSTTRYEKCLAYHICSPQKRLYFLMSSLSTSLAFTQKRLGRVVWHIEHPAYRKREERGWQASQSREGASRDLVAAPDLEMSRDLAGGSDWPLPFSFLSSYWLDAMYL